MPHRLFQKYLYQIVFCLGLPVTAMLTPACARAQVFYSTNPSYLKKKTEANNLLTEFRNSYPDTSVATIHRFFPRNFLGNIGLPSPFYLLSYGDAGLGFRLYQRPYEQELFHTTDVAYFRSAGPYAELTGIAGSKQLQVFKMRFTHTYRERLNVTLRFNRYTSTGFYVKQQSYVNNFYLSSNAASRSGRSGYYLFLLNNGHRHLENGGLRYPPLTDVTLAFNKDVLPVKLYDARRNNRETAFMINPWLRLNGASKTERHHLQVKSRFARNIYQYTDSRVREDDFYSLVYLDTARTNDSTSVRQWSNELAYTYQSAGGRVGFSAGYRNEANLVWQKNDSLFLNHIVEAALVLRKRMARDSARDERQLLNVSELQYVAGGANAGDMRLENRLSYSVGGNEFFLNALVSSRHPDYIHNRWISNNFQWMDNGYVPQRRLQALAGFRHANTFTVSLFGEQLDNFIYFDQYALPRQYKSTITNAGLRFDFSKVFFRHLGIAVSHVFQHTSHDALVRMPANVSVSRLFYSGSLFRNNLQLQTGVELQLYQSFEAYDYMPSTQVFYLQEGFRTGDFYPFADIYLNARIRPVSVFVKIENALQGYAGTGYSFVPGYYQPDRALRFGITWMFFD